MKNLLMFQKLIFSLKEDSIDTENLRIENMYELIIDISFLLTLIAFSFDK